MPMGVLSMLDYVPSRVTSSFGCSKIKAVGIIAVGTPGACYTSDVNG